MNQLLFERSMGSLSPQAFARIQILRRVDTFQVAPNVHFDGGVKEFLSSHLEENEQTLSQPEKIWAHKSGLNALSLDIDDRLLISGGADSSIKLWNLESWPDKASHTLCPVGRISKCLSGHKFGITQLSWYSFDSAAFLSSSYDHHLKIYATEHLALSADFDLNAIVYTHALSPIASHLLVACATQHPAVRLVDLRSGSHTHALAGHHGAILSLAWHPVVDHILASGATDGVVRLWDIRKSSGALGILDAEDMVGVSLLKQNMVGGWNRHAAKAHQGAVNGMSWTDDENFIITAGHDAKVRVWNASTGANTLASFGPTLKNGHLSNLPLLASPSSTSLGKEVLIYPNERELLMFDLHEGKLLKRLRVPGPTVAVVRSRTGEQNVKNRITGLVWRGKSDGMYTAHTDGQIRAWLPKTAEELRLDQEELEFGRFIGEENVEGKRKRQVLDDVYRDLTRQKIRFG